MARSRRRQLGGIDRLPSGKYRARVLDPTTTRRVTLGSFTTKADAERAVAQALTDQGRGKWVAPEGGRQTFKEYADEWLANRLTKSGEPLRELTRELYEGYLRLHINPTLGALSLNAITVRAIRKWHKGLLDDGPGASTTAKCYRLVRAIFNTAVNDNVIGSNPCKIEGAGVEPSEERPIITVEQVMELAAAIEPRFRLIVLLAAFVGPRKGELLGLTRRDLNLRQGTIKVERQRQQNKKGQDLISPPKTKAGKRTVALPVALLPEVRDHVNRWVESDLDAFLFTGAKGGKLRPHVLHNAWVRARKAVGLDALHFHDLRHVAGTLAAASGVSTKQVMHRLGHASPQAALRYQHAVKAGDKAIADAISRLILGTAKRDAAGGAG